MFKTCARGVSTNLPHHVCSRLPAPRADVLVEGDVEVRGRLVVLDHVEQRRGALRNEGMEKRGIKKRIKGQKKITICGQASSSQAGGVCRASLRPCLQHPVLHPGFFPHFSRFPSYFANAGAAGKRQGWQSCLRAGTLVQAPWSKGPWGFVGHNRSSWFGEGEKEAWKRGKGGLEEKVWRRRGKRGLEEKGSRCFCCAGAQAARFEPCCLLQMPPTGNFWGIKSRIAPGGSPAGSPRPLCPPQGGKQIRAGGCPQISCPRALGRGALIPRRDAPCGVTRA